MVGRTRSLTSKVSGCPRLCGKRERRLQERRKKRRRKRRGGTISHRVAMAIGVVAGGTEPMEVDPPEEREQPMEVDAPEDQEQPMEVDPPPAGLRWHHHTVPGLPSVTPSARRRRSARPTPYQRPSLQTRR